VVAALDEPAILVAHSRNGIVISQAAEARPDRVRGLVYLAAYLVPDGRSMMDYALLDQGSLVIQNLVGRPPERALRRMVALFRRGMWRWIAARLLPARWQTHALARPAYRAALYHDCPDEIARLADVLLEPEPNWAGFTPLRLTEERYGSVPRTYIECLQDRAVTLGLQRRMQADSPCGEVIALDTGHSPFFAAPEALVAALERTAARPIAGDRGA
jgi:pimeloyl-ACP methyl ester carboxylesterase